MSDKGLRIVTATVKEVAEVKCEQFYHFRAGTVKEPAAFVVVNVVPDIG